MFALLVLQRQSVGVGVGVFQIEVLEMKGRSQLHSTNPPNWAGGRHRRPIRATRQTDPCRDPWLWCVAGKEPPVSNSTNTRSIRPSIRSRARRPIRNAAAQWELDAPRITGPTTSLKMLTIMMGCGPWDGLAHFQKLCNRYKIVARPIRRSWRYDRRSDRATMSLLKML